MVSKNQFFHPLGIAQGFHVTAKYFTKIETYGQTMIKSLSISALLYASSDCMPVVIVCFPFDCFDFIYEKELNMVLMTHLAKYCVLKNYS